MKIEDEYNEFIGVHNLPMGHAIELTKEDLGIKTDQQITENEKTKTETNKQNS